MIAVPFNPATLTDATQIAWWNDWQTRADKATVKVIEAFETWFSGPRDQPFRYTFNSDIWTELKKWLLEYVFHKKCAYCECEVPARFLPDAEHYRPKGAVLCDGPGGERLNPECSVCDPLDAQVLSMKHPGYFWLAYDWRNLVPSCKSCNSGKGKNEQFHVAGEHLLLVQLDPASVDELDEYVRPRASANWPGYYYLSPADLDKREKPLLLNPLNAEGDRDPREHLCFGVRGVISAKSPLGEKTIDVLQLRDEDLRQERQRAQFDAKSKFYDLMRNDDEDNSKTAEFLDEFKKGRRPYSAAALDYLKIIQERQPRV